ncbi:unnamed protein product (macronuclear) [Paramecium tetraurelia]|uniref:Uncharacterized protein n=1 Tax=Paramecium tetraurelia TaxID=5888 RepID=A0BLP0_PARTE|nr:uncharacterized protein GSPATT00030090001 [Paramecium tetraurelia]CAK59457.1 unnamed protein product [Paramecium tetraurelia]|eukprot:XP_001426855.1 hypothetical protein (macronuclear) [Paramecium tetraurelia strain d4-2]
MVNLFYYSYLGFTITILENIKNLKQELFILQAIRTKSISNLFSLLFQQGVNLKQFGAFTIEVISDYVKPLQHSCFKIIEDLEIQRVDRKHVHSIRRCFIPDNQFKYFLQRYPERKRYLNFRVDIQFIKKDLE